ncbi:MAG: SirB1 family protein [Acidimicrobiales bacterium]
MVNGPRSSVDLTEGALLLSAHARPDLDLEQQSGRVDAIASRCAAPTLDGLRDALFVEMGFTGDADDYYDPENSLLDSVLDRRRGLPITLSVLLMEVGRRLGLHLDGVAMPGHFLVRDQSEPSVFVDAFSQGRLLGPTECEDIFGLVTGAPEQFDSGFLEPVAAPAILSRMAANLVNAYSRTEDRRGIRWACVVRAGCPDVGVGEMAQLGANLASSGALDRAAEVYERAAGMSDSDAAVELGRKAMRMRAQLN